MIDIHGRCDYTIGRYRSMDVLGMDLLSELVSNFRLIQENSAISPVLIFPWRVVDPGSVHFRLIDFIEWHCASCGGALILKGRYTDVPESSVKLEKLEAFHHRNKDILGLTNIFTVGHS